jgi:hypothetical protein
MKWKRSKKAQQEAKAKDEAEKRKPTSATSSGNAAVDSKVKEGLQENECGGQQTASSRSVSPSTMESHSTSSVSAATSLVLEQNFQPQGTATTRVHHLHHHHLQNHHRRLSLQDGGEALYRPYVV